MYEQYFIGKGRGKERQPGEMPSGGSEEYSEAGQTRIGSLETVWYDGGRSTQGETGVVNLSEKGLRKKIQGRSRER